jgi:hypothetical protein
MVGVKAEMMKAAQQHSVGDVRSSAFAPRSDVMGFGLPRWAFTAWPKASSVSSSKDFTLRGGELAARAPEVEDAS